MDRDATPAPLLGAESLTPVTQGTWELRVVLVEHVSQMAGGQGLIQRVHVSPHCVIMYPLHTDYKHAKELLYILYAQQSIPFPKPNVSFSLIKKYTFMHAIYFSL